MLHVLYAFFDYVPLEFIPYDKLSLSPYWAIFCCFAYAVIN